MLKELSVFGASDALAKSGEWTISDVARYYDVSLRTLRFYEDKGLLNPRRQGTARFYSGADRVRLELILKGKRLGFTLSEIYELIASRTKHRPNGAGEDNADLTVSLGRQQIMTQIQHLEKQRKDLDEAILELRQAYTRIENVAS